MAILQILSLTVYDCLCSLADMETLHSPGLSPSHCECEGSLPTDSVRSELFIQTI